MNDRIKSFSEYLSSDETLKEELKTVLEGKEKEELVSNIIQFAKKHGHELAKEDFDVNPLELDENELKTVVGGDGCGCPAVGAGSGGGLKCACLVGGSGIVEGIVEGGCVCFVGGSGGVRKD